MSDLLAIAEREISRGRKVFIARGKFPAIPKSEGGNGCLDATTDILKVEEWVKSYPDATGLGMLPAENEVFLDIDKENLDVLDNMQREHGILETAARPTPGGGYQYVFRIPDGVTLTNINRSKNDPRNIELKVKNQYVLAGGSIHPNGGVYQDFSDTEPEVMPEGLVRICLNKNGHKPAAIPSTQGGTIPDGQRNASLASIAGAMRNKGAEQAAIEAALLEINNLQCKPPLPDGEVRAIAKSVSRYEAGAELVKSKPETGAFTFKNLSDVDPESIDWLWYPYIPKGKFTLLEGDPGLGKSWICEAITTALTLGHALPNSSGCCEGNVLICSAEDGIADTIKPRLLRMGAKDDYVFAISELFTLDDNGFVRLDKTIALTIPVLVIIDPLVAYLSAAMDINKANQARYATARLQALAEKWGCAILAVRHTTKTTNIKAIYKGLGSIDFSAAARSILFVGVDPDDENNRAIVHVKSNLSEKGKPIGYELREGSFYWKQTTDLTYDKINSTPEISGAKDDALTFIKGMLSGGEMLANDVFKEAKEQGISESTLKRAKEALEIETYRKGQVGVRGGGKWYWKMPGVGD